MATIASLAVQISANPSGVTTGVAVAQRAITKLGGIVSAANSRMVLGRAGGFATPITSGVSAVQVALKGLVSTLSGIPIVGGFFAAIPTTLHGLTSVIQENIREMSAMQKQADKLGLSMESFSAITVMAGGDAELMERGLFKLGANLGQLAAGSQEAIDKFGKFGMAQQDFADLGMDESLRKIMEKTAGLSSYMERAHLQMELMGRGGVALVPLMSKGGAAMDAAAKRARELGLSFSSTQGAGVMRAAKAMREISLISKGMQRQLSIEFAPVIGTIAEGFTAWLKSIGGIQGVFRSTAQHAGLLLGNIADGFDAVMERVEKIVAALERVEGLSESVKNYYAHTPGGYLQGLLFGKGEDMVRQGAKFGGTGRILRDVASSLQNLPRWFDQAAKSAGRFGQSLPNEAVLGQVKKISELRDSLFDEVKAYGQSSHAAQLNKATREAAAAAAAAFANVNRASGLAPGMSGLFDPAAAQRLTEQSAAARAAKESLDGMLATVARNVAELKMLGEATEWPTRSLSLYEDFRAKASQLNDLMTAGRISAEGYAGAMDKIKTALQKAEVSKAADLFRDTRTPVETFRSKLAELGEMLDAGAIQWQVYERAVASAGNALISASHLEHHMAPAMEAGSQEAFKTIANATYSGNNQNLLERVRQSLERQEVIQQRQLKDLDDLARAARKGFISKVPL